MIRESVSALNMDVVNKLVEAFMVQPSDVIQWLTVTCQEAPLAKTLFFVVLMQSLHKMSSSSGKVLSIVYALKLLSHIISYQEFMLIFL